MTDGGLVKPTVLAAGQAWSLPVAPHSPGLVTIKGRAAAEFPDDWEIEGGGYVGAAYVLAHGHYLGMREQADPTRLDPPVPITVEIWVKDPRVPKILSHLLRLTGGVSPEGVCDREGEERAEAALRALFDGRHGGLLLTHLDAEGRPTFALAPPPAPPLTREEQAAKTEEERAMERVRQIGRFLFSKERIPLEVDTVEGDDAAFKPEPGDDGQRFTLVECALEEGGAFTPAPAETKPPLPS